ncbi:nucleoside diphosphate kinase 3 isoform X5 [Vulpes vulpes]|uniref:nucleoside-diphosphate kinase n=1 Tax=Vulpes vulpes TaxID=9627 RepID=A0ABM5A600_VULVU
MLCLMLTVLAHLFPAAGAGEHERTFLAVKPDGVQRRLVGEIVRRFERKGFKLVALKLVQVRALAGRAGGRGPRRARPGPTRSPPRPHPVPTPAPQASDKLLREHYAGLRERPFYGRLVDYMRSGPVVAMVSAGRAGRAEGAGLGADPAGPRAGVAGAGRGARSAGAHWGHRPGRRGARHHPRGLLRGGT